MGKTCFLSWQETRASQQGEQWNPGINTGPLHLLHQEVVRDMGVLVVVDDGRDNRSQHQDTIVLGGGLRNACLVEKRSHAVGDVCCMRPAVVHVKRISLLNLLREAHKAPIRIPSKTASEAERSHGCPGNQLEGMAVLHKRRRRRDEIEKVVVA